MPEQRITEFLAIVTGGDSNPIVEIVTDGDYDLDTRRAMLDREEATKLHEALGKWLAIRSSVVPAMVQHAPTRRVANDMTDKFSPERSTAGLE